MNIKGFTLVEILIVMAVSAITGSILIAILASSNGLFLQQNSKVTQGLSLNDTTDQITSSIRQASQVVASYPSNQPQYITSSAVLVLAMPSIDSSNNIIDQK